MSRKEKKEREQKLSTRQRELEILLEGNTYTITSDKKGDERIYRYLDEELELADIRSAIKGLRAETFTDETPDGKEEISLTIRMDNDNYPETTIQLYRYNGEACIAVVDREPVAFVARASVVDLVEAVNGVVLKQSSDKKAGGEV